MSRLVIEPLGAARWEAIRNELPGATAFHRHDFLQLASQALGGELRLLGDPQGRALIPLLLQRRGPWSSVNWVPFPYLGPLAEPGAWAATVQALDQALGRLRLGIAQVGLDRVRPEAHDALVDGGWQVHRDRTLVVDTAGASLEALHAQVSKSMKRSLRVAERSGLTVRAATAQDVLEELPRLAAATFARQGKASDWPALRTAQLAWERLNSSAGWRATAVVEPDGETRAVGIIIEDGATHYLWWGATARLGRRDFHAPAYWDAISRGASCGAQAVDLVGAPTETIVEYKARFGAAVHDTLVARRVGSRAFLIARRAHDRLMRRPASVPGAASPAVPAQP